VTIARPKFLRVARQQSDSWWQHNQDKMLVDEDPQVFMAYLYTVYFGMEAFVARMEANDPDSSSEEEDYKAAIFLADIHLLADKLRDPTTANLAIDQLLSVIDRNEELVTDIAVRVYTSAKSDSPLRRLVRDFSKADNSWAEIEEGEASLQDVTDGMSRMEVERPKGLYHRENDQYEVDGGWTRGSGVLAHQHLELRGQTD
jgi:hypothetical protein